MTCSACGEPIESDQLRCKHCGHDMLPEDIARRPLPEPTAAAAMESQFLTGLLKAKEQLATSTPDVPLSRQDLAELAAAGAEMKRRRWMLVPILAAIALLAAFFIFVTAP